ncbi:MAG: magnesium transporter [Mycoplasmataceae bacterium]|nr:magnesium transporter [Mycoplasmataceae bacterium]
MSSNSNFNNVKELIQSKDIDSIRKLSEQSTMSEIVEILENLSEIEAILFFRFLKTEKASEVFSHLDEEMQENIIKNLTKKETSLIINELYTNEIADLIEELPSYLSKTVLLTVNKETRSKVNELLKYNENQVGSIMSVDIILLKNKYTNKVALQKIKEKREESEISQIFFVVDKESKLLGSVTLEEIVFSQKEKLIIENIKPIESVTTLQDKEAAAQIFVSELLPILPVVDKNNVVLGMLTHDDVIDIINEEVTEDIYKGSGISSKEVVPYPKARILSIAKSRIFWLLMLMIGATMSQVIIDSFSEITAGFLEKYKFDVVLSSTVLLAGILSIIPVISSSAGNAGSQASSTITRSIALNELKSLKFSSVVFKELKVGLILGTILMFANFLRLMIYYLITGELLGEDKDFFLVISAAASIALFVVIVLSKIVGTVVPMLGSKFKKDPAVMASPVLTTLIDALSTLIFFGVTLLMLTLLI